MERLVGRNPPFHHPVYVLTHYAREPLALEGGKDVALAGGAMVPHRKLARR